MPDDEAPVVPAEEPAAPDEDATEGDPAETHTGRMRVYKRQPGAYWDREEAKRLPATPPVESTEENT